MDATERWLKRAQELDRSDPLAVFRERFVKKEENLIYLDGNSLGMLNRESEKAVSAALSEEWGGRLIRGWNDGWWEMPSRVASKIAMITGCRSDEIAVCDSTSVNLFKLLSASLRLQKGRKKVVSDTLNFPSDIYIAEGAIHNAGLGHRLCLAESENSIDIPFSRLEALIDEDTAVVVLSLVQFKSGFMYDMARVNRLAHEKGALVIWDLSHATGAVEIDLNATGSDMAIGCTYKYLNGGPGSPAFLFVRKEMREELISPLWGWLGEYDPFSFARSYRPAEGATRYMTGSPPVLSMASLEPSLDIILEAGMPAIRKKSVAMTQMITEIWKDILATRGFTVGSPSDPGMRGSHMALRHSEGFRICRALISDDEGEYVIIPDFRPPDIIRLGFAPLYNSFTDIAVAATELDRIVRDKVYELFSSEKEKVT
ncbi:MAG: kynureninase [Bacteroidales bacterium]|nr:kynureninase [Bacteroidales bacterium]